MVRLVVFGDIDPISCVVVWCSTCNVNFSKKQNCTVWEKCDTTPLTWTCLQNNSQVRRESGHDNNSLNAAMLHIPKSYNVSNHFLSHHSYDRTVCKEEIDKSSRKCLTVQLSERIGQIQQATTHCNLFDATGGGHLTLVAQKMVVEMQSKDIQKGRSLLERCWVSRERQWTFWCKHNHANLRILLNWEYCWCIGVFLLLCESLQSIYLFPTGKISLSSRGLNLF